MDLEATAVVVPVEVTNLPEQLVLVDLRQEQEVPAVNLETAMPVVEQQIKVEVLVDLTDLLL
jgi:predicted transcriptional regulator